MGTLLLLLTAVRQEIILSLSTYRNRLGILVHHSHIRSKGLGTFAISLSHFVIFITRYYEKGFRNTRYCFMDICGWVREGKHTASSSQIKAFKFTWLWGCDEGYVCI
jgi:hypothetical protein